MLTLLTVQQVADRLSVHGNTVRKAIRDGRLEAEKYGRDYLITEKALAKYRPGVNGRPPKAVSPP